MLLLRLGSSLAADKAADPDVLRSEVARFEVRKPAGRHFRTLETALANRAAIKTTDEGFQEPAETEPSGGKE